MLKKILLVLVAVVAVYCGYIATLPSSFSVTRSTTISAAPDAVFANVNNFRKWDDWSPWAKRDPNAKTNYDGPEEGKGAKFSWAGNSEIGKGKMEIEQSTPSELIKIRLDFEEPFPGTSYASFQFKPEGSNTEVTWTLSGDQSFSERFFTTLLGVDLEVMIGKEYEIGLANLKRVVEGQSG